MAAFGEPPSAYGEDPRYQQEHHHAHPGDGPGVMPRNPLMSLFNQLTGGQPVGDAVYSQEALDRIITQLMEQNASDNAPAGASQSDIDALPKKAVTTDMLGPEGHAECSICMEAVTVGEQVTELPCHHWFHDPCIAAWLREHDTCPHCRKGITKPTEPSGSAGNSDQNRQNQQRQGSNNATASADRPDRKSTRLNSSHWE